MIKSRKSELKKAGLILCLIVFLLSIAIISADNESILNNSNFTLNDGNITLPDNETINVSLGNQTLNNSNYTLEDKNLTNSTFTILGNFGIFDYIDNGSLTQNVNDCATLNTSNGIYTLTSNIVRNGSCFIIMANNITFDGAGFTVNFSANGSFGYAINITNFNFTTIKNFIIKEGTISSINTHTGIFMNRANNGTILNNSIVGIVSASTTGAGLSLSSSSSNNFTLNNMTTRSIAITLSSTSSNNYFFGNFINSTTGNSITLSGGVNNSFINNTIQSGTNGATGHAVIISTDNNTLINNTIDGSSSFADFRISSATNNVLKENKVNNSQSIAYTVVGSTIAHFNNSIDTTNLAEGLPVLYNFSINNEVIQNINGTYGQIICAWCTNVTYTNINLTKEGISLVNSSGSAISSSNINTSVGYGVYIYNNGINNVIENNTIVTSGSGGNLYGIYVSSTNNTNITNNSVSTSGSTSYGIYLLTSSKNNVNNNLIFTTANSANGIYMLTSANENILSNNTINVSGSGARSLSISSSNYNSAYNSTLYCTNSGAGFRIFDGSNNYFNGAFISCVGSGNPISFDGPSTNNTFSKITAYSISGNPIILTPSSGSTHMHNFTISDSVLNFTAATASFASSGQITGIWNFTNITRVDGTSINISLSAGSNGTFNYMWYLDVNVTNSTLSPLENATVNITNINGTNNAYTNTSSSGQLRLSLLEYVQNETSGTNKTYFSNYSINVANPSYFSNSSTVNLSTNKNIQLSLTEYIISTTDCGTLNLTNRYYQLANNVTSNNTCFFIGANNITVDGAGYTINYSNNGTYGVGFNITGYNFTTIKNAIIQEGNSTTNSKQGIYFLMVNNATIQNNTIKTRGVLSSGLIITTSNDNQILNNNITMTGASTALLSCSSSSRNTIKDNIMRANSNTGSLITLGSSCLYSRVINNTLSDTSSSYGIRAISNANNNIIINNTINNIAVQSISLESVTNTTLVGNRVNSSKHLGYVITGTNVTHFNHSIDTSNWAEGFPVLYNYSINNEVIQNINSTQYGQIICAWCTNVTYNNITMGGDGISLINSSSSAISSSNINTSVGYGVYITNAGLNNIVSNNTLVITNNSNLYGIYVSGTNNTNITNNSVSTSGSTSYGIYLFTSSNGIVDNNKVNTTGSTSYGIYLFTGSSNNIIRGNNASASGSTSASQYIRTSDSNSFLNNSFNSGTYLRESSHESFINNSITGSSAILGAIVIGFSGDLVRTNNNTFISNRFIAGGSTYGLAIDALEHNFTMQDNIINGSAGTDIFIAVRVAGNIINFTNVTNDRGNPVNISWTTGGNATLNVYYYLIPTVIVNQTGAPLTDANVSAWNVNGVQQFSEISGSSGNITKYAVLSYIRNGTSGNTTIYYSPYTINATKTGFNVFSNSTINVSNNAVLNASLVDMMPDVSFTGQTPANGTYQQSSAVFVNLSSNDTYEHYSFVDFDKSLVLWMRMDDVNASNSSAVTDISSYSNNGSALGGAVQNMSGKFGKSFSFGSNTSGNRIFIPSSQSLNLSSKTISLWLYLNNNGSNGYYLFEDSNNDGFLELGTNALSFSFANASGSRKFPTQSGFNFSIMTWSNLVIVYNITGSIVNISSYKNGVVVASTNSSEGLIPSPIQSIGARFFAGASSFNGSLDELMVFNRSLSSSEILSLYNASVNKYYNNFTGLSDGQHNFKGYAVDSGGNLNSTELRSAIVDSTAPNGTLATPANNTHRSSGTNINFTADLSDIIGLKNATLWIFNSSGLFNSIFVNIIGAPITYSIGVIVNLVEGIYNWFYEIFDLAGNRFVTQNNTLIIDTTNPLINFTAPTPVNNTGRSGSIIINASIAETNLANITLNWNGTLTIFNSSNGNITNLGSGSWIFTYNQSGLGVGQSYYYNLSVLDIAGNINRTETRIVLGNSNPTINSVAYSPNLSSILDPGVTVYVNASAGDSDNNLDSAILQWKNSTSDWTNVTMRNLTSYGLNVNFTSNLTLSYESNYTLRIAANDTQSAWSYSNNYTLGIFWDCTWNISLSDLGATAGFNQIKGIGNITINNTGDIQHANSNCSLEFRATYNLVEGRIYYNGENIKNLQIPLINPVSANSSAIVYFNATFLTEITQENVIATIDEFRVRSETRYENLSASLVTNQNSPYLYKKITSYSSGNIYLTSGNFTLSGYIRNLMGAATENVNLTAYNVSFYWTLPDGLTNLSGDIIKNYTNINDSELHYNNLNVTFSDLEEMSSGAKEITLYAYGYNVTGSKIVHANNVTILSESVNITFACYNVSDGVAVTACGTIDPDNPVSSGSSTTVSSGGGGGGGGAGSETIQSKADYTITRGKESEIIVPFRNRNVNASLTNLKFSITGEIAKYIKVEPETLSILGPMQEIKIKLKITSPTYLPLGRQDIVLKISGQLGTNSYDENRKIALQINALSREDSEKLINNSESLINELRVLGLNADELLSLLDESKKAFGNLEYEKVQSNYEIIKKESESAVSANKIIKDITALINEANKKGIDTKGSERLLKLAELSLERTDYSESFARAKESRNTYALEVKGEIGKLSYYLKNNTKEIALSTLFLALISFTTYKFGKFKALKHRIKKLKEEEFILIQLIKLAQDRTFKQKKMDIEEYRISMLQYEKKIANVIENIIDAETEILHMLKFSSAEKKLKSEKQRVVELVKEVQYDYLKIGKIESKSYEVRMESYNRRLGEIDEKLAEIEAKGALEKI